MMGIDEVGICRSIDGSDHLSGLVSWSGRVARTVDVDGVLMAAVQGLNASVDEKQAEIARQQRKIAELESRLARLEAAMKADSAKSAK